MNFIGRILAGIVCLAGLPIHLLLCLAIRLQDGGPALYLCPRLGWNGKFYAMFKYRTMQVNCPPMIASGFMVLVSQADARVTRLGRWLRCGIDEFPQLWNIVRGEMNWVGPRPDPEWMLENYGPVCRQRIAVLPGITGLAQVMDSRYLSTADGFAIDLWYIAHRSLWLDAWVVLVTPFFIAGWRSIGRRRLHALRNLPEFEQLLRQCTEELAVAESRSQQNLVAKSRV